MIVIMLINKLSISPPTFFLIAFPTQKALCFSFPPLSPHLYPKVSLVHLPSRKAIPSRIKIVIANSTSFTLSPAYSKKCKNYVAYLQGEQGY
jgi:hypothetical protein